MTQTKPVIAKLSSPNFNARAAAVPLQFVILHYTGMKSAAASIERLCDPKAEVSAHYVIDEQGKIFQLVDEKDRAWHAGKSSWRGVNDINSASIGIEMQNPGHQFGYRAFPAAQIAAVTLLVKDILARHNLPASAVLGHADIAPGRKEDPGELFPWQELAMQGIGLSVKPESGDYAPCTDGALQELLAAIGYDCPATGDYDRSTRAALLAFQRHYHQTNLTGTPEPETVARIRALARAYAVAPIAAHGVPPINAVG